MLKITEANRLVNGTSARTIRTEAACPKRTGRKAVDRRTAKTRETESLDDEQQYRVVIVHDDGNVYIAPGIFDAVGANQYVEDFDKNEGTAWIAQEQSQEDAINESNPERNAESVPPTGTWTVLSVVKETGELFVIERGISKRAAAIAWRTWHHANEESVLLLWPDSQTMPAWMCEKSTIDSDLGTGCGDLCGTESRASKRIWSLLLVVPEEDGEARIVDSGLTKREASIVWRAWKHKREGVVLILWPGDVAFPPWIPLKKDAGNDPAPGIRKDEVQAEPEKPVVPEAGVTSEAKYRFIITQANGYRCVVQGLWTEAEKNAWLLAWDWSLGKAEAIVERKCAITEDRMTASSLDLKVKVFVIRYIDGDCERWFPESMDRDTAFAMGKRFARLGRKPELYRIDTTPRELMENGTAQLLDLKTKKARKGTPS